MCHPRPPIPIGMVACKRNSVSPPPSKSQAIIVMCAIINSLLIAVLKIWYYLKEVDNVVPGYLDFIVAEVARSHLPLG